MFHYVRVFGLSLLIREGRKRLCSCQSLVNPYVMIQNKIRVDHQQSDQMIFHPHTLIFTHMWSETRQQGAPLPVIKRSGAATSACWAENTQWSPVKQSSGFHCYTSILLVFAGRWEVHAGMLVHTLKVFLIKWAEPEHFGTYEAFLLNIFRLDWCINVRNRVFFCI